LSPAEKERSPRFCQKAVAEQKTMAGIGPITQDWEPVVIRKKPANAAAKRDEKTVNAARRSGADIETVRKCSFFFPFPNF